MDIEEVLENGNCHQCGVCVGVCPTDAIKLEQHPQKGIFPVFKRESCTDCDLCYIACPGEEFDWNGLQQEMFGKIPADKDIGHVREFWSGYTTMEDVRRTAASGGIVSAILIALLEKGEIDGAVVVKMDEERPLEPKVYIARTRQEVLAAQQSKYLPVPTGVIIEAIMKEEGRFAVVGLPCHIHGIRLAQQKMPRLRKRIVLQIGLICGFHPSFTNTTYLIRRAGVKNFDEIKEIRYRDDTWPGGFNVIKKDGTNHILHPVQEFFWAHAVFERVRCATCTDAMAEFADIVCGDEWRGGGVPDRPDYKDGWSYIMTRTEAGSTVIAQLVNDGVLYVEPAARNMVKRGMLPTINLKKRIAYAYIRIRKFLGLAVPNYHTLEPAAPLRFKHYLGAAILMVTSTLFENRLVNTLFLHVPTRIMSQYLRVMYKCLCDGEELDNLKDHDYVETTEMETVIRDNRRMLDTFANSDVKDMADAKPNVM
ncbi:MAG: Coenzyme F420 hydrogenase/dehydrogenase, beta subunit C-terminal domain [bacterium]